MRLSTKGRYGVRVMLDLAVESRERRVTVKEISRRQSISGNYLEQILIRLKAAGLVDSCTGPKGGFSLAKQPSMTTLKEILDALDCKITLADCIDDPRSCNRSNTCLTRRLWIAIERAIEEVLSSTLFDLIECE